MSLGPTTNALLQELERIVAVNGLRAAPVKERAPAAEPPKESKEAPPRRKRSPAPTAAKKRSKSSGGSSGSSGAHRPRERKSR